MTILNAAVARDRVVVAQDTLLYSWDATVLRRGDGTPRACTKLFALPHMGCVLAGAGSSSLKHHVITLSDELRDMDDALERLPDMLRCAGAALGVAGPHRGRYAWDIIFLAGWSARHGGMLGAIFESDSGFREQLHKVYGPCGENATSYVIAPFVRIGCIDGLPNDDKGMLRLARQQVEHYRDGPVPYGGHLNVATITREAITIVRAGDIGLAGGRPSAVQPGE